jgi:hypothetical protein
MTEEAALLLLLGNDEDRDDGELLFRELMSEASDELLDCWPVSCAPVELFWKLIEMFEPFIFDEFE